jgi:predicted kinase
MSRLVIMRGLPGCGKSTMAREWVSVSPGTRAEVNRDAIRLMLGGYTVGSPEQEKMVTKVSHNSIRDLLKSGVEVVCSDTNLQLKHVRELMKIAADAGAEVGFEDMTNVPIDTVLSRNKNRSDKEPVPEHVIWRMYNQNVKGMGYPLPLPVEDSAGKAPDFYYGAGRSDALVVDVCDIDGTVASCAGIRSPYDYSRVSYDKPRRKVIDLLMSRDRDGYGLIFMSGRPDINNIRHDTEAWLKQHIDLPYEALLMRPADRQQVNDSIVKRDLFDDNIRGRYDIGIVLDDRDRVVSMWRRQLGLDCLQVQYGDFLSDRLEYMTSFRKCPTCGREIRYENARSRDRADQRGSGCHRCTTITLRVEIDGVLHKRCSKCEKSKPLDDFNKASKSPDGKQGYCRECGRTASKNNYYDCKEGHKVTRKQFNENLQYRVAAIKAVTPCADCGAVLDPVCMDFDHLPGFTKEHNIVDMVRRRMTWSKIEVEMAKCEVVCANCHRLRTKRRRVKNAQMQGVQGNGGKPRPGSEMTVMADELSGRRITV